MSWLWVNSLESHLSHELKRFNSPRYCLSHELIRINFSGRPLGRKPQKGHTKLNRMGQAQKGHAKSYPMGHTLYRHDIIESWVDFKLIFQTVFWVVSECESKFWKAFSVASWFESKLWKVFWVVRRFESKFWKAIWVMTWFDLNSRKPFRVMSWFESILKSHCDSRVESESKLSETELNRIKKNWVVPMSAWMESCPSLRFSRIGEKRRCARQSFFAIQMPFAQLS